MLIFDTIMRCLMEIVCPKMPSSYRWPENITRWSSVAGEIADSSAIVRKVAMDSNTLKSQPLMLNVSVGMFQYRDSLARQASLNATLKPATTPICMTVSKKLPQSQQPQHHPKKHLERRLARQRKLHKVLNHKPAEGRQVRKTKLCLLLLVLKQILK